LGLGVGKILNSILSGIKIFKASTVARVEAFFTGIQTQKEIGAVAHSNSPD
jgi:hypothetical protein